MKKLIVSLALSFLFAGAGSVFAQLPLPGHSWGLGGHLSHIKYEEPGIMQEEGYMFGVDVSHTYRSTYVYKVEGHFSYGQVDYSSPISGTLNGLDDYLFELRGLLGYDIQTTTLTYTPYIGLGYRYLYDDLRGTTSTGAVGYRRKSNYYYMPVGVEALIRINADWSVGPVLEYDIFLSGVQESLLSDTGFGWGDISNDQEEGYGFRTSVKFYRTGTGLYYVIEPYYVYWDIEDSNSVPIPGSGGLWGMEPKNNSNEFGIRLGVIF